jgi:hypothetical protein
MYKSGYRLHSQSPDHEDCALCIAQIPPATLAVAQILFAHYRSQRYYHLYQQGELEGLIEQASGLRIVESGYDCDNWFVICERLAGH